MNTQLCNTPLRNLMLPGKANYYCKTSGIDNIDQCWDKEWFELYPYEVAYQYNSRGFRDTEWPTSVTELKESIWCIGDSFTVGIGNSFDHTWPQLLQKDTGCRTINIGMDGASNDYIANRTIEIANEICPKIIVLQWSFLHRRESSQVDGDYEFKRILCTREDTFETDYNNFVENLNKVNTVVSGKCRVIHSIIPDGFVPPAYRHGRIIDSQERSKWSFHVIGPNGFIGWFNWGEMSQQTYDDHNHIYYRYKKLINEYNIIALSTHDRARDGYHYGIKTAQMFVDQITTML